MPVNTTIQIRKGTATQWSSPNPVLVSGEPGFDTTNNLLKIGDGSTAWNSLASANLSSPTLTGTVTISGGQIAFPATANLSAGANTLDDYEEGTWNVTIRATSTNPTATYTSGANYGMYVKIGKTVFITGTLSLATLSAAGSGTLFIPSLPFAASAADAGGYGGFSLGQRSGWTTTSPGVINSYPTLSRLVLYGTDFNTQLTQANLSATSYVQFCGFYTTGL